MIIFKCCNIIQNWFGVSKSHVMEAIKGKKRYILHKYFANKINYKCLTFYSVDVHVSFPWSH